MHNPNFEHLYSEKNDHGECISNNEYPLMTYACLTEGVHKNTEQLPIFKKSNATSKREKKYPNNLRGKMFLDLEQGQTNI